MKTLKDLAGIKKLSKKDQKQLVGGRGCNENYPCPKGTCCSSPYGGVCTRNCD